MFTDFTVTTSDGKTVKLSDYVGKDDYVLVDFWASWCGPCMREMPGLKEIYGKYNGKGLQIVGVAVWDAPDDTRKAVEAQQLPWTIIDNAQCIPTDLYGIMGIPHIIMFAPDGTIAFRGLTGNELHKAVDDLMAKR
jgi:thiol-disulfide isomerase/thioredoxin